MDILGFIVSINKISLLAFFVTLGFLVYEVYMIKKERRKAAVPQIPKFQENMASLGVTNIPLPAANKKFVGNYKLLFFILILLLILFGTFTVFGFLNASKKKTIGTIRATASEIIPLSSRGIKIYDTSMNIISEGQLSSLSPGQSIIIGIETIKNAEIDQARIRVNKTSWDKEDITKEFNLKHSVFYIEYIISQNEKKLTIEAELHSKSEGWLSE